MRFARTMTVQKTSNQPRERQRRDRERVRKGKPKPPVAVGRLSKERKRRTAVQCIFEGKISAACTL